MTTDNKKKDIIEEGIKKDLIKFDDERKYITYVHQNKRRNYSKPEEQVEAWAFLKLVLDYNYKPERIGLYVSVVIGSDTKEADIIVYNNDEHTSAHIVVECKKENVSELEFNQAVAQAFSYAATGTVRAKYFWVTSKIKDVYFEIPEKEPKKHIPIPDVPQYGVSKLAKFKYAKGGGSVNGQKLFELEKVTENELTRRFKQAHNALWGGGELNPSAAFDELDKLIFCKLWDERKPRKKGEPYEEEPYDFQIFSEGSEAETNKELQKRIHTLYEEGREKDPEVFKDDIRLSPEKLRTVVGYLESIHLGDTDLDSKGRAFETFMGSFFRGDFGQFFTPRPIVKFIVDVLPITHTSLVLDTSCGSGGFLLHALDKVRHQADEYYEKETIDHYKYWHDFAKENLYGIEINEQIARTAKMNMIIHDDGHTNVVATDGLLPIDDIRNEEDHTIQEGIYSKTQNKGFAYNRFDFIITNPPFGSKIKQTEQAYMHQYGYAMKDVDWLDPKSKEIPRDSQSTEVLFIEQCHNFLREGGYLAIVVPDGILTNSSLQYVRDDIEEKYRIVAVVSMPQTAFQATGAGVKSSVLFLKKHTMETTENIRNRKFELQDDIKEQHDFLNQLAKIEQQKKEHIQGLRGFDNPKGLKDKALTQSDEYKEWKKGVNAEYKEKINALKDKLNAQYLEQKQKALDDYPIFMAIAEDIGYDATGRPTNSNELDLIGKKLARFIEAIETKKKKISFQPSSEADNNKVFLTKRSELMRRFDIEYYQPSYKLLIQRIVDANKIELLSNCAYLFSGNTPRKDNYAEHKSNYPIIKVSSYSGDFIDLGKVRYTQGKNNITAREKDIYILSSAHQAEYVGRFIKFLNKKPVNPLTSFVGELLCVRSKDIVISEFLFSILNTAIYKKLINREKRGQTSHIYPDDVGNIKIPIPPKETQSQIVAKMDAAYAAKKQKEAEAQQLLDSIDDYLLGELGIESPEQEEKNIQDRIFTKRFSEVSGGRLDVKYYNSLHTSLESAIHKSQYPLFMVKELIKFIESGRRPKGGVGNIESGVFSIGGEHINDNCEVGIGSPKYIPVDYHEKNLLTETKLNNIVLVKDGATTGKIGIIENPEFVGKNINEHVFVIHVILDRMTPLFFTYFLHTTLGQALLKREITGATVTGLTKEAVKSILIPTPPITKQIEIASHISAIREQAKELQSQAKVGLEQAKKEVEAIILGEEE